MAGLGCVDPALILRPLSVLRVELPIHELRHAVPGLLDVTERDGLPTFTAGEPRQQHGELLPTAAESFDVQLHERPRR